MNAYDIGLCLNKQLDDENKLLFLKNTWTPMHGFIFPTVKQGNQNRCFQREWLNMFKWLAYSDVKKGGFCKYCVIFQPSGGGQGCQPLKAFVTEPFLNFKKGIELLKNHGGSKLINNIVSDKTKSIMEANRKRLTSIIKTIIFCGHNNISLRGHRDDGILDYESAITGKEGIFRSLLSFRLDSGDNILKDHFKSCGKNSTMISKTIQNEIINVLHQVITESIVKNIKKNVFFSIICDETTDVSTKEQLSFSVRTQAALMYDEDIPANSHLEIQAELELWKTKWANTENPKPQTAVETLVHSTAERSFSSLRRLKNYMRSSMTEDRLNGLAVLHIHKEIPINIDDVINIFSRQKQRRMKTEDWSKD
ncbi:uncharacterized protein LOC107883657 [Acyrthosiphon pisum]|uniref:TTF-type domain-containing protein n=1 Tax=Acyrthosiphon pisum TaxID=7029 RepID=A0A8R2JMR9_ACYPI|nr:uncharacterized protein LOC107883657 [Acyrthosiphon pisum]